MPKPSKSDKPSKGSKSDKVSKRKREEPVEADPAETRDDAGTDDEAPETVEEGEEEGDEEEESDAPASKKPRYAAYVAPAGDTKPDPKPHKSGKKHDRTPFAEMQPKLQKASVDFNAVRRGAKHPNGIHLWNLTRFDKADPTNPAKNDIVFDDLQRNVKVVKGTTNVSITGKLMLTSYIPEDPTSPARRNTKQPLHIIFPVLAAERLNMGPAGDLDVSTDRKDVKVNPYDPDGDVRRATMEDLNNANRGFFMRGFAPADTLYSRTELDEEGNPLPVSGVDARGYDKDWRMTVEQCDRITDHIARLLLCMCQSAAPGPGSVPNEFAYAEVDTALQMAGGRGARYATMTPEKRDEAVRYLLETKTATVVYPDGSEEKMTTGLASPDVMPMEKNADGALNYLGRHQGTDQDDDLRRKIHMGHKVAFEPQTGKKGAVQVRRAPVSIGDDSPESKALEKRLTELGMSYNDPHLQYLVFDPEDGRYKARPYSVPCTLTGNPPLQVEVTAGIRVNMNQALKGSKVALLWQPTNVVFFAEAINRRPEAAMSSVADGGFPA